MHTHKRHRTSYRIGSGSGKNRSQLSLRVNVEFSICARGICIACTKSEKTKIITFYYQQKQNGRLRGKKLFHPLSLSFTAQTLVCIILTTKKKTISQSGKKTRTGTSGCCKLFHNFMYFCFAFIVVIHTVHNTHYTHTNDRAGEEEKEREEESSDTPVYFERKKDNNKFTLFMRECIGFYCLATALSSHLFIYRRFNSIYLSMRCGFLFTLRF